MAQSIFPCDGDIEVNNLRAVLGPEQIAWFDIAMVDPMAMQVHQAARHLARELEAIGRGKELVVEHFAHVEAVKKFEHEERWAIARQEVGIDDLHDMIMCGQVA